MFGVSRAAVSKWIASPNWTFGPCGPWNLGEVGRWRKAVLRPNRKAEAAPTIRELPPLLRAQLKKTLEEGKIAELRRRAMEGALHDVAECRSRRLGAIQAVKSRLADLGRSLAPRLAGKGRDEIERVLTDHADRILRTFAGTYGDGHEANNEGEGARAAPQDRETEGGGGRSPAAPAPGVDPGGGLGGEPAELAAPSGGPGREPAGDD